MASRESWCLLAIPALRWLRQEDRSKFEVSLGYMVNAGQPRPVSNLTLSKTIPRKKTKLGFFEPCWLEGLVVDRPFTASYGDTCIFPCLTPT